MPLLETFGGALFGAVLQVLLAKLDTGPVLDYFRGRKLDQKLLRKLKVKLLSINAVIDDAEQKQFSNSNVKAWLDELKDAAFNAEDLLDEIHYEVCKWELEAGSEASASKVHSFDMEIESRMKQVLDDLEFISSQMGYLGLKNASDVGVGSGSGSKVSQKLPSTSSVAESVFYGRVDDKEMIFNWLTSDTDNHNQLSILSIVGMGGVGKTTLAQHVHNDPRMEKAKFGVQAWVCVSDEFDVLKVTKTILGAITDSPDDSTNLEMAQGRLKKKLTGRKFLLVLDDVWNEDRDQWKALQTPLNYGAPGSKIIVTTRSNKVASTVHSNKVHELKQLQEDSSWQVFEKHAFRDDNYQLNAELKEVGMKIVRKCKGLPLALQTVGCLLHTKSAVSEWESVLRSNIWEFPEKDSKIIPALLLSYFHLPSHLKRCFAYCALFPKDYQFDKERLILLWMAENFLQCSQQSKRPEEVGEQYFNDLLSRSFFQLQNGYKTTYFVMHDLLNDLAKYVYGNICFRLGVDKEKITGKTRHLSLVTKEDQYSDGFGSLYDAKWLRTFMPTHRDFYDWRGDCKISIHDLFSKWKFLRVLSFSFCVDLEEVPDFVSNLKLLRSLDLSYTSIRKLPDSTCSLFNLQILKLNSCRKLEELPSNLHKLINLCRLELEYTYVRKMPMHLGELKKNLQVLMNSFYVGESSESSIRQLGELNLHHGSLSIGGLQNIVNPSDALAADLKNKTHLVELELKWSWNWNPDDLVKDREVLEYLQPSKHLEELTIENYGGTQFPGWFSLLMNMVSLKLHECKNCRLLPCLGVLPFLKDLAIRGLDGIVGIDADFYGSSSSSFTSLETLSFYKMMEWEQWECKDVTGAFPCLQRLSIEKCPKLKGHLPEQLCHLKYLKIHRCKQLVASAPKAPEIRDLDLEHCGKLQFGYDATTLKTLRIRGDRTEASSLERTGQVISDSSLDFLCTSNVSIPMSCCYDFLEELYINGGCDSLTTFPLDFFPNLRQLCLWWCHDLQTISQGHTHNHLKVLQIWWCRQFESFPGEGLSAPRLEWFIVVGLENLKSLPERMHILLPSLSELWIRDCPQVESFSNGGLPSNLKYISLSYRSKLVTSLKGVLGSNPSLETLHITEVDVESFPDEGLLPLSLTSLQIVSCPDLKKLDYKGLCQLSSLEKLSIGDCPSLQCLPEEGLPKSISQLEIWGNCWLLKQRCQKPEGEDWEKIAHIKNVSV